MASTRVGASILPSIRCSDCGVVVELSLMGEHVCSKQIEAAPLHQRSNAQVPPKSSLETAPNRLVHFKATKAPPLPPLQTNATGRSLIPPNELTPTSSGKGSDAFSPTSTSSSRRSPFRAPSRGMTMRSRARPPSPELTNLDCAFPPFPTKTSRSNTPVPDSRSQNSDNESSYVRAHAEPYNAPPSRRRSTSSSRTRKRSKTSGGAQDSTQTPSTTAGSQRRPSLASVTPGPRPGFPNAPPLPSPLNCVVMEETQHLEVGDNRAPSSGGRNDSQLSFSPPKAGHPEGADTGVESKEAQRSRQGAPHVKVGKKEEAERSIFPDTRKPLAVDAPAPRLPKPLHQNEGSSYRTRRPPPIASTWLKEPENGITASSQKPRLSPSRSQTFPLPTGPNAAIESSNNTTQRRPSEPSVMSQPLWPLAAAEQASSVKSVTQAALPSTMLFSGRSYHSQSDSASSYGSVNSVEQSASSRSSQPLQDIEAEKVSDVASKHGQPAVQEADTLTPPKPPLVDYEADSPTDPAFQNGRLTPVEPPGLRRTQTTPEPPTTSEPDRDLKRQPILRSKTTGGDKGQCRGCSEMIAANQKSVSSADGRLTGRYHKECFSCTTCHSAFATADFYVLKDQPYCAQHYHALNGSLCGSCGRGIEGQYLEATRSETKGVEKFHAKCFTCVMCRIVLKHDYFAHHGRFFCEGDIHRVASPPNRSPNGRRPGGGSAPGGSSYLSAGNGMSRGKFPERRSTKLMIMS